MFRVTSLAEMPESQLNRWIKRLALVLLIGVVGFIAFYAVDRFRAPAAPLVDRETAAMEEAVRTDPTDLASRGRLADLYLAANRYDDAIAQYTEIIGTGKQDEQAYISRGLAYQFKGDLDAADTDFAKVVEIAGDLEMANVDPMLQTAYYGRGWIALLQARPQDAVDSLVEALAIKRTDADTMNLLGQAYVQAGQPDKAVEQLRNAILFVPTGWADPYQGLADAYTATGETAEAEWASAMAQAMNVLTGGQGDTSAAETRLEAIADGDAALDARIGLGLLAELRGDNTAATDWYSQALEIDSENTAAELGLSRVSTGTQGHPDVMPSPSTDGSN
jgi:tetratricopeptide (TPR) repeat protein